MIKPWVYLHNYLLLLFIIIIGISFLFFCPSFWAWITDQIASGLWNRGYKPMAETMFWAEKFYPSFSWALNMQNWSSLTRSILGSSEPIPHFSDNQMETATHKLSHLSLSLAPSHNNGVSGTAVLWLETLASLHHSPFQTLHQPHETDPEAEFGENSIGSGHKQRRDQRETEAERDVRRGLRAVPFVSHGRRFVYPRRLSLGTRKLRLQCRNRHQGLLYSVFLFKICDCFVKLACFG